MSRWMATSMCATGSKLPDREQGGRRQGHHQYDAQGARRSAVIGGLACTRSLSPELSSLSPFECGFSRRGLGYQA
jgi:hypothetical protein